jgi:nicotinate dehydrogenase subunit A
MSQMTKSVRLEVNGIRHNIVADPGRSLLSVLREELKLTGAKYGCGEGACGACTVLIDGRPGRSCVVAVGSVDGKAITTIEGLERAGQLHPVQQAFLDEDALQCGYCTPGMILTAVALLDENRNPAEADIIRALDGNICRCGTYGRIVRAVRRAAEAMRRQA